MRLSRWPGLAATLLAGLAGCGDSGEVSKLSYADVKQAAAAGDQASFRSFFRDLRGQRVAWRGRVVEVAKEHGDDFVEITTLVVDLDGDSGGTTDGDARFPISASLADEMIPGREVARHQRRSAIVSRSTGCIALGRRAPDCPGVFTWRRSTVASRGCRTRTPAPRNTTRPSVRSLATCSKVSRASA
jgi:hypothetical protein